MTEQERNQWIELGLMLDLYYENCITRIGEKWTHSALHGLACLECNGVVYRDDECHHWSYRDCDGMPQKWGYEDTHPAALLAMLKAHRENNSRPTP
jgi:hypothetical protein